MSHFNHGPGRVVWLNQPSQLGKTMCFRGLGDTNRRRGFALSAFPWQLAKVLYALIWFRQLLTLCPRCNRCTFMSGCNPVPSHATVVVAKLMSTGTTASDRIHYLHSPVACHTRIQHLPPLPPCTSSSCSYAHLSGHARDLQLSPHRKYSSCLSCEQRHQNHEVQYNLARIVADTYMQRTSLLNTK